MNTELKIKWLEALRSGEYIQTTEVLHRIANHPVDESLLDYMDDEDKVDIPAGFCCLGVLCKVMDLSEQIDATGYRSDFYYKGSTTPMMDFLSDEMMEDIGLEEKVASHLAEMNDSGNNFPTIADYIENNI